MLENVWLLDSLRRGGRDIVKNLFRVKVMASQLDDMQSEEVERRTSLRNKKPNTTLDMEGD